MSSRSRRLVLACRLLALALIALHLAAPLMQEPWAWGLWPATYLPVAWRWGLAASAAALALAGDRLGQRLACGGTAAQSWLRRQAGRVPRWESLRLGVAVLAIVPFYVFRIVHTRWGDAYIIVNSIANPQVRLTYEWMAPLDVFLHAKTWVLGNRLFGWPDAAPAYALWSPIAGAAFVWVLLGLAKWAGRARAERWLIVGLVGTLGTLQLFFGYIENYTLACVGILAYCWLALEALRGETALLWPAVVLALTHALNPSTVFVAPSLLYVAWHAPRALPGGRAGAGTVQGRWQSVAAIAVPYVAIGLGVLAFMTAGGHGLSALLGADGPGGGDHNWFVPLIRTTTRWEHYTMFSLGHLIDVVNEQLLAAPTVWAGILLVAALAWRMLPLRDRQLRFLFLLSGLYLLLTLTWNADYGGQRDWDLFSLASVPAALTLAYALPRVIPERDGLARAGWALVAAQAFHTVAWVYQNTLPWSWPKG